MIEFKGFPVRMQFTSIPNIFFSSLLPQITDITELKVLLHIFEVIYPKKGSIRFVSYQELLNRAALVNEIKESPQEALSKALQNLIDRGAILHLEMNRDKVAENIYFLNSEANRLIIERIRSGEITLPGLQWETPVAAKAENSPDIFTLYEQNIGMLTPLVADELRESQKQYPESWIKEAIKEAVSLNKRNWRYIARILEHWSTEGKDDGTYRGYYKKNTDPDKYVKGKYGHMVQR